MSISERDKTFRFDIGLVYRGYIGSFPAWYGFDCDKILYKLILGHYEIVKVGVE